jgi:hypothetical protein
MSPPMSNDQPQWAKDEATNLAIAYVDWLGRDTVDADAEQVLAQSVSQALLSAYERGRTEREWQPIETAPKDGKRVLCWNHEWLAPESGCLYGMAWAANGLAADKGGWKYQPTYWMPLPAPPAIRQLLEVK